MENIETILIIAIVLCITLPTIAIITWVILLKKQQNQLQRYWDVKIGMNESQMLMIMGENYNRSLLKNNRIKYEWRINATSYNSTYKGISTRSYSGVQKVTIYVKNGLVEEVKSYNV